ncbi:hypothetical protein [Compostibacter hankyongensis]|uniref:FkbM family methyltransferase n=1 Tax=Compostibacter hankyongensis TaxID=1007089 RepID=A0ABP8G6K8_9BACT
MQLIDKIFSRPELQQQPPVLLDIGASGEIHFRWKKIARYSICIAFDPDEREYRYITRETGNYKKLHVFNCIVSDLNDNAHPFYLTASPFCSSFLSPRADRLAPYDFARKFEVEKQLRLPVRKLTDILAELQITYVDWFKTDSQGLDLRIFRSLGDALIRGVKIAEFEPGIMDAYMEEDKLHQVLAFMDTHPFFLSRFTVKGPSRISPAALAMLSGNSLMQKLMAATHKKTAGWGELVYLNTFERREGITLRDYLLGGAVALLNEEYGLALELMQQARQDFSDPLLEEIKDHAAKAVRRSLLNLRFLPHVWRKVKRKTP